MTKEQTINLGDIPVFQNVNIRKREWKDGLIVRMPNWLGDAVMATPAILQLKKIIPKNCGLFVITTPELFDYFSAMNIIDIVIPLTKKHSNWSKEDKVKISKLQAGVALMFNNSLRDAIFLKLCGIKKLYGAAARGRSIILSKSFNFPKITNKKLNKLHHTAKYLSMSYALGAPQWTGELPKFSIKKQEKNLNSNIESALQSNDLLVIAPGAAYGDAKRWPVNYFQKVCQYWLKQNGQIAIIGTKAELLIANELMESLQSQNIYNLAGKTNLQELILILQKAKQCVANDSGVMHLSAIVGSSGVAIFGSTDPSSTSPVSNKWTILYEKEECSPCFKRTCPLQTYKCLTKITPEMVINSFHNSSF